MLEKGYYDKADAIIESHGAVEASLIPIIQAMEEALWEQERIGEVLFWRLSILRRMLRFGTL